MPRSGPLRLLAAALPLFLAACGPAASPHPDEAQVRQHLENYFATWSAQDMEGYGDSFHPHARITYLPSGAEGPRTDSLTDFLFGQRMGHKTSPQAMVEVPTSMQIQMEDPAAQALVRWQLTKGTQVTTGTDFFTLIRTPAGWKIINLVFYAD